MVTMNSNPIFKTSAAKAQFASRKAHVEAAHKAYQEAKKAADESTARAFQHAVRCGRLFLEIKNSMERGEFERCLPAEFPNISRTTIQNYMNQYRNREIIEAQAEQNGQRADQLSQREAMRFKRAAQGRSPAPSGAARKAQSKKIKDLEQTLPRAEEQLAAALFRGARGDGGDELADAAHVIRSEPDLGGDGASADDANADSGVIDWRDIDRSAPKLTAELRARHAKQAEMLRKAQLQEARDEYLLQMVSQRRVGCDAEDRQAYLHRLDAAEKNPHWVQLIESSERPDEALIALQRLTVAEFVEA